MPLRVNNNIAAINTQRLISRNVNVLHRGLERLSSGLRVNRASDDAAGLAVSEGLRSEVARLGQNVRNAQQGSDLLQTAEGSLQEVNNMLVRMKELANQSATSTVNDTNRESIAAEFDQLVSAIDRIVEATTYNSSNLLTGFGNQVSSTASTVRLRCLVCSRMGPQSVPVSKTAAFPVAESQVMKAFTNMSW